MHRTYVDQKILEDIQTAFPAAICADGPEGAVRVGADALLELLAFLQADAACDFDRLGNLTAVDYPDRFELVYHLHSSQKRHTIAVKADLPKDAPAAPSVTALWPSANFQEREVYDLLGVRFTGHPNLTRILLPDDFAGHPLRKDFKPAQTETRC